MANLTVEEDGGGDYTTLDEACDNIGATETITIQGAWDNTDTRNVVVSTDCIITATGDARVTTARHVAGAPTHYRLYCNTNGSHCFDIQDTPTTIDGIDIRQEANGGSEECFRMSDASGTVTIKNCIALSDNDTGGQDVIYVTLTGNFNVEQCIFYKTQRSIIHLNMDDGETATLNVNSCSFWDSNAAGETRGGGISIRSTDAGTTVNINVHNTFILDCSDENNDYTDISTAGTRTWGISYSIDSDNSIAARDGGGVGNQASRAIADSDQGVGAYVIVNDITGAAPSDLSLLSLGNAKNNAEDEHAVAAAEGLTIPGTDIDGTIRPQNINYDVGAFEIVAAVGANPKGPLGMPLIGPFGGPI